MATTHKEAQLLSHRYLRSWVVNKSSLGTGYSPQQNPLLGGVEGRLEAEQPLREGTSVNQCSEQERASQVYGSGDHWPGWSGRWPREPGGRWQLGQRLRHCRGLSIQNQGPRLCARGELELCEVTPNGKANQRGAHMVTWGPLKDPREKSETRDGDTGKPTQEGTGTPTQSE